MRWFTTRSVSSVGRVGAILFEQFGAIKVSPGCLARPPTFPGPPQPPRRTHTARHEPPPRGDTQTGPNKWQTKGEMK